VATNTGEATLPVTIAVCETNPTTGACLQTPAASVATTINAGATPTFGVFVTASGTVPFRPANYRIFVTFTDSTNAIRGETSAADGVEPGQGAGAGANRRRCRTAVAGCTAERRRALRRVTGTAIRQIQ
jgi:hypothetical protein